MNAEIYLKEYQTRINHFLSNGTCLLPAENKQPAELHKAMRYAVLNGGKRIRAALVYATGEALGADFDVLDHIGSAIEMIHAFSLIHDDLPALDNDDLRRGKPSCHKAFSEATAILAGDALQTLAFETIASLDKNKIAVEIEIEMIRLLARAIGSLGMAGGEELDIEMKDKDVSLNELENTYKLKTGYLLTASILLGALAANCHDKNILNNLQKFGDYIGLAFQIHDDIIGIESDTQTLGKHQGSDQERNKPTYPTLIGMQKAKQKENEIFNKALKHLKKTGIPVNKLEAIAHYVVDRNF